MARCIEDGTDGLCVWCVVCMKVFSVCVVCLVCMCVVQSVERMFLTYRGVYIKLDKSTKTFLAVFSRITTVFRNISCVHLNLSRSN